MSLTERTRRPGAIDLWAAFVFVAGLVFAGFIWRYGPPGLLAIHFDFHGRPDRWGDRTFIAMVQAGLTALLAVCYAMMGLLTRGKDADDRGRRGQGVAKLLLLCMTVLFSALNGVMAFGAAASPELERRILPAMLALIFLVVGALLGRAGPNPFVGMRTYWSLRSRLAWDKSNRLAGRLFFWIGLAGLLASPFLAPEVVTPALIVGILGSVVAAVFESWRVWRTDPERAGS
jgi:uncharacterized membrane protein